MSSDEIFTAWQRQHAAALEELQDAQRAYHRTVAATAFQGVAEEPSAERPRGSRRLPTGSLRPNPHNPRRTFSETELEELAASLRETIAAWPVGTRFDLGRALDRLGLMLVSDLALGEAPIELIGTAAKTQPDVMHLNFFIQPGVWSLLQAELV